MHTFFRNILLILLSLPWLSAQGQEPLVPFEGAGRVASLPAVGLVSACDAVPDTTSFGAIAGTGAKPARLSLYELPYSLTASQPDWPRLWLNAGIFAGAYVGTLAVLECLPEGATNWNRASIENMPWYERWKRNVIEKEIGRASCRERV